MKLNAKGMELYDKWEHIYVEELTKQREQRGDQEWCDGWCIIDDYDHIHDINDEIGLLIFGYDDYAIYHVLECIDDKFVRADEIWGFDTTSAQLVELMKPYFDIDENEDLHIA
jgi:hypothetical protein